MRAKRQIELTISEIKQRQLADEIASFIFSNFVIGHKSGKHVYPVFAHVETDG